MAPRPSSAAWLRGVALWALLLALPFAVVGISLQRMAASIAVTAAASLHRLAGALPREVGPAPPIPTHGVPPPPASAAAAPSASVPQAAAEPQLALGVMVSRKRVRAAVRAGAQPGGSPVPATAYRPAGLSLTGVSAIGAGLRDGDVLTLVGGAPATSYSAVAAAVSGALDKGARAIHGEAWRGRTRIYLTVELPRWRGGR